MNEFLLKQRNNAHKDATAGSESPSSPLLNDNESITSEYLDEIQSFNDQDLLYRAYKKSDNNTGGKTYDDKQEQTIASILFSQAPTSNLADANSNQETSATSMTIENTLWFLASVALIYFTDIINVFMYDKTVYR
jgi:hypothetical protein